MPAAGNGWITLALPPPPIDGGSRPEYRTAPFRIADRA
jgi:hypothetical protein